MDLMQFLTMLSTAVLPVKTNVAGTTANIPISEANIQGPRSQAFAGGDTHPATLLLALELMQRQGQDVNRFTGFNDYFHRNAKNAQGNPVGHAAGLKFDVTATNPQAITSSKKLFNRTSGNNLPRNTSYQQFKKYDRIEKTLLDILKDYGISKKDRVLINEFLTPSARASGAHIDAGFKNTKVADKFEKEYLKRKSELP